MSGPGGLADARDLMFAEKASAGTRKVGVGVVLPQPDVGGVRLNPLYNKPGTHFAHEESGTPPCNEYC